MDNNQPIKCGKVLDIIKKISDALFKGFDKLISMGCEVDDKIDEPEEGVKIFHVKTGGNKKFDVKITDNKDGTYQVYAKVNGVKPLDNKKVKSEDFAKVITEFVDNLGEATEEIIDEKGNDIMDETNSSKTLSVTLKRVCASTGDEIHLTSVNANYNACEALSNLDAVLSDDDFVNQISDTPVSFSIVDEGNELDVSECDNECVQSNDYILTILRDCLCLRDLMQFIHWNAKGENMKDLHSDVENYYWSINSEIDFLAELQVELFGSVPNPSTLHQCECDNQYNNCDGFTSEQGYDIMKDAINEHVSMLNLYYCNFTSDVQSVLDDWIRSWNKHANYFIKQIRKS